jgi:serine/threonine-protein kinase
MVLSATRSARPLGSVAPEVAPEVAAIVDRALSFDRAGRWPSAAAMRDAVKQVYRAHYDEDPAPGALVFMASPERMPVSDRSPMLRSPMASTVPETPVSAHAKRGSDRPASSPTSLVGTAAQPRTLSTGRVRVAAGAVILVVAGVMLGAWGATKGRGAPSTVATMTTTAITGATVLPAVASSAPPVTEAPLATTTAPVATTNTVAAAATQPPAPAATPLVVPGRLRPLTLPTAATPSATIAATASARVDRFDRQ